MKPLILLGFQSGRTSKSAASPGTGRRTGVQLRSFGKLFTKQIFCSEHPGCFWISLTLIFDIGIINKGTVEWEHLLCLNDSNSFLSFLLL